MFRFGMVRTSQPFLKDLTTFIFEKLMDERTFAMDYFVVASFLQRIGAVLIPDPHSSSA